MGKILFGMGLVLLFFGMLLLSFITSLNSILALFFGMALILTGLFTHVGVVTSNSSKRQRIGAALIITSLFFVSGAAASMMYTQIKSTFAGPYYGVEGDWIEFFREEDVLRFRIVIMHPFIWLAEILFLIGIGLLIIGFITKYR